jgi:hypothetical protein
MFHQTKFLRHFLGITKLDRERNQSVREKLGVQNIFLKIKQYQREWLQHVERMDTGRVPKQTLKYRPKGKRSMGHPRNRWNDRLHLEGQRTGTTPNTSQFMMMMMMMMIMMIMMIKLLQFSPS